MLARGLCAVVRARAHAMKPALVAAAARGAVRRCTFRTSCQRRSGRIKANRSRPRLHHHATLRARPQRIIMVIRHFSPSGRHGGGYHFAARQPFWPYWDENLYHHHSVSHHANAPPFVWLAGCWRGTTIQNNSPLFATLHDDRLRWPLTHSFTRVGDTAARRFGVTGAAVGMHTGWHMAWPESAPEKEEERKELENR